MADKDIDDNINALTMMERELLNQVGVEEFKRLLIELTISRPCLACGKLTYFIYPMYRVFTCPTICPDQIERHFNKLINRSNN